MSSVGTDSLAKPQIKRMTKEKILQEELDKANQHIELLKERIDSLTKELNCSLKQNKYENQTSYKTQLSEIKSYKNKVKELQTSLKNLERDSKQQIEKISAEKRLVISQIITYKQKIDKHESEEKRLGIEVSRKIDEIGIKNNEIMREKEKSRLLEGKVNILEKHLKEAEKEKKIMEKKHSKTRMDESADKTKRELKAKIDSTSDPLSLEKQRHGTLSKSLVTKERDVSELLRKVDCYAKLFALQAQSQNKAESDLEDLKRENKSLKCQIKALTENRERDQDQEATDQEKENQLDESERIKNEDLNDSIESKEDKVEDEEDIASEDEKYGKDESKVETQANDQQVRILPPLKERNLQLPKKRPVREQRILCLNEGKLEPDFKEDVRRQESLKQLKPKPPPKRKPEISPFAPAFRKRSPSEINLSKTAGSR